MKQKPIAEKKLSLNTLNNKYINHIELYEFIIIN